MPTQRAIVIGGGFSGVTAARDLARAGVAVTLLEASDRLGGRTMIREFAGVPLEFGGTWVLPDDHPTVMAELAHYGIGTDPTPDPERFVTRLLGEQSTDPHPPIETFDAVEALFADAPAASPSEVDGDLLSRLEEAAAPAAAIAWIEAFNGYLNGASAAAISADSFTGITAHALVDLDHYTCKIAGGTAAFLHAIFDEQPVDAVLGAAVTSVTAQTITLADGRTFSADVVVVAVPLNVLSSVEFDPPLDGPLAELAASGHPGRSTKLWLRVSGLDRHVRVATDGPLSYLRSERMLDDGSWLVVVFGRAELLVGLSFEEVSEELTSLLPDARLLETDSHDWNADPLARGTWMAHGPGQPALLGAIEAARVASGIDSGIQFAGADLSLVNQGTIEAAIRMGAVAAASALEYLAARATDVSAR